MDEKELEELRKIDENYLELRQKTENLWKEIKEKNFPSKLTDEFFIVANKARLELYNVILFYESRGESYRYVKECPGYKRAIMLLEKEKKYSDALYLSLQYQHISELQKHALTKIDTAWCDKKIKAFMKKLSPEDQEKVLRKQYKNEKREYEAMQ